MHPLTAYLCIAVTLLTPAADAALATACWRMSHNQVESYYAIPCGIVTPNSPVVACCNLGSYCLSDGICLTPGVPETGFTGYYTGGCTDASYNSPACNPYCRDLWRADIIYNNASQMWSCCGTESDHITVNCDAPTKEIFNGSAPSNLYTIFSVGSAAITGAASSASSASTPAQASSSPTSMSTSTSTSTSSSTSTSAAAAAATASSSSPSPAATSQASSSGLSTGAKAGIGVGAAVGALALLAAVILLIRRRQRRKSSPPSGGYVYEVKEAPAPAPAPLGPHELGTGQEQKRAVPFPAPHIHELS